MEKAILLLTWLWLQCLALQMCSQNWGGKEIRRALSCESGCPARDFNYREEVAQGACLDSLWFNPSACLNPLLWTPRWPQPPRTPASTVPGPQYPRRVVSQTPAGGVPNPPGSQPEGPAPPSLQGQLSPWRQKIWDPSGAQPRPAPPRALRALSLLRPFKEDTLHLIYF